jgi:general secretion pathway protein I
MIRRAGWRHRAAGFTLIEVIVALAIVALGMAALLSVLSSSAGTVVYLRDKTFATWVAENKIATTRLTAQSQNQAPQTGDTSGEVDLAGRSWHWQQSISAAELPGMVRIDVSVRPADIKTADDKRGWYTTVTGMYSEALGQARGDMPPWSTGVTTAAGPEVTEGGTRLRIELSGSSSASSSSSSSDPFASGSSTSSSSSSSSGSGGLR